VVVLRFQVYTAFALTVQVCCEGVHGMSCRKASLNRVVHVSSHLTGDFSCSLRMNDLLVMLCYDFQLFLANVLRLWVKHHRLIVDSCQLFQSLLTSYSRRCELCKSFLCSTFAPKDRSRYLEACQRAFTVQRRCKHIGRIFL
jgi:hypothetical protein